MVLLLCASEGDVDGRNDKTEKDYGGEEKEGQARIEPQQHCHYGHACNSNQPPHVERMLPKEQVEWT